MTRETHRNLFDPIRLVAALLVFYYHCYPLFGLPGTDRIVRLLHFVSGGSLGVAIFFSISGYLVTQSLGRSASVRGFYAKRARRIFPALAAVLLITALVLGPLLTTGRLQDYFLGARPFGYVAHNMVLDLQLSLPGVFEANPVKGNVNGSLWTLQSEVALYLLLPVLARLPAEKTFCLSLCALAFGGLYFWCSRNDPAFSLGLFGPMVEVARNGAVFFTGAALATVEGWKLSPRDIVLAAILLVATAQTSYGDLSFLVLLPLLVIGIGRHRARFRMPFGVDISYGFYLYAFPVQQATYQLLAGRLDYRALAAVALVATAGFATASWFLVERPFLGARAARRSVAAGAAIEKAPVG